MKKDQMIGKSGPEWLAAFEEVGFDAKMLKKRVGADSYNMLVARILSDWTFERYNIADNPVKFMVEFAEAHPSADSTSRLIDALGAVATLMDFLEVDER